MSVIQLFSKNGDNLNLVLESNSSKDKVIIDELWNKQEEIIPEVKGKILVYKYNSGIPKSRITDLADGLEMIRRAFGWTGTQGIVDNTLEIDKTTRAGDKTELWTKRLTGVGESSIEVIVNQHNKVLSEIGKLNELLRAHKGTNNPKPYFGHVYFSNPMAENNPDNKTTKTNPDE